MPTVTTPTYAELDAVLNEISATLHAPEVHALFLGALTSTSFRLGPHHLLDRILGEDAAFSDDPSETLGTIVGYWNTLVSERDAGRVKLAPAELSAVPTRDELIAFTKRRHDELTWYVRGIDAGGDDPMEFGPEGQELLARLAEAGAYLRHVGRRKPGHVGRRKPGHPFSSAEDMTPSGM